MPESETTGSCSKQLSPQLTKRNCRYGKCEQIKNGTDYVCHCDMVIIARFFFFSNIKRFSIQIITIVSLFHFSLSQVENVTGHRRTKTIHAYPILVGATRSALSPMWTLKSSNAFAPIFGAENTVTCDSSGPRCWLTRTIPCLCLTLIAS